MKITVAEILARGCPGRQEAIDILRDLRNYLRMMRRSPILDALFPAVRQGLLAATLLSSEKWWYLSELASHLGTSPSSLQRELDSLTRSGVLQRKQDGRRTYYKARSDSPVFHPLRELFSKTAGIVPALQSEMTSFGNKIRWAAIYGSVARGEEAPESDIDLLLVGDFATADLVPVLRRIERQFGREVNVTRYSEREFRDKMRGGDHFLKSVTKGKLVTLAGSSDGLEKATRRT
jgi:predicted nucleotidyltransferase/AraC-like DNA-binding protein